MSRKLRRRAIAKAVNMTYVSSKCGGYDLKDKYGSIGTCGIKPNDEDYMTLISFNKGYLNDKTIEQRVF